MRVLNIYEEFVRKLSLKKSNVSLVDYMVYFSQRKEELGRSNSRSQTIKSTIRHIVNFSPNSIPLNKVDKEFCIGFIKYLKEYNKNNKHLSIGTQAMYFNILNCVINRAIKEELITNNPIKKITIDEKIPTAHKQVTFLTADEIKIMEKTDIKHCVKDAFLFCCYCGLRYSDVSKLTWNEIFDIDNKKYLCIICKKTGAPLYVPLCNNALKFLPKRNPNTEYIFNLPSARCAQYAMKNWCKKSKLNKKITFHTSRHTFATLLYTNGADIYTISKLLGHKSISSTQIYASVIDKKKFEAVALLDQDI